MPLFIVCTVYLLHLFCCILLFWSHLIVFDIIASFLIASFIVVHSISFTALIYLTYVLFGLETDYFYMASY